MDLKIKKKKYIQIYSDKERYRNLYIIYFKNYNKSIGLGRGSFSFKPA